MLLWWPDKCLTSSCSVSNHIEQKQQLKRPFASGVLIILRWTEHKCFNKCAFCLNIATHKRHANGFSPVCTRKCVFKFHDIPNCLPQYSQRYSRTGAEFADVLPVLPPVPVLDVLFLLVCWFSREFSELAIGFEPLSEFDVGKALKEAVKREWLLLNDFSSKVYASSLSFIQLCTQKCIV